MAFALLKQGIAATHGNAFLCVRLSVDADDLKRGASFG